MNAVDRARPYVLSLFRIVVAFLFVCHGLASLFGVLGGVSGRGDALPAGNWPYWWAALIEFVAGVLVLVGLGTRVAALVCSGAMAYAYFSVHQPRALFPLQSGGDLAVLFCWAFLLVAIFGPGPWSLDRLVAPAMRRRFSGSPAVVSGPSSRDRR
ncbi:DoxX family protein [Actinoallomurus sp. NPDC050550]|uniref:DoxX family protein n=1 Tax=Actinoallomurus sp. NPDC050550 TaxID=3154937 RepID=UPI0033E5BD2D